MSIDLGGIRSIYERLFFSLAKDRDRVTVTVGFYPYVGISNKIRLRDDLLQIKLSDLLVDAPAEFHEALAEILIRKLLRRKIPPQTSRIYNEYLRQPELREKSLESRRSRGRKVVTTSHGAVYDLEEIFTLLNGVYFRNTVPAPTLTWSAQKTYRILGHHDATHETIVISKSLDSPKVPRYVVEYVVFHEMLHIKHPVRIINGRRYVHTAAFKREEETFAFFEKAETWIEKNVGNLKKSAKKNRWWFFD